MGRRPGGGEGWEARGAHCDTDRAWAQRRRGRAKARALEKKPNQEKELEPYQVELLKLQRHLEQHDLRMIVVFEGRDAAGKGGTIRRITRYMNEKHYRVVALGKPTAEERSQWYLHRYATPWTIIRSGDKHLARLNAMKVILGAVDYDDRDRSVDFVPHPDIVVSGSREVEIMDADRIRAGKFSS